MNTDFNIAYMLFYVAMGLMALAIAVVVAADRIARKSGGHSKH